jgi:hypothetical protein
MKVAIQLADPDGFPCTVTITATMKELKALRDQTDNSKYPGWDFRCALTHAISDASKVFYGEMRKDLP